MGQRYLWRLRDDSTGNQVVFCLSPRPGTPVVSAVYNPGAGSAANVIATGDLDKMLWFGNFGSNVGVIEHAIVAASNTDISPTTIGTDEIQPIAVNPADPDHIVAINEADQDALETTDGGTAWATLNAALGQTVAAMAVAFFGSYFPFSSFIGGDDGTDTRLDYTPNEFNNLREDSPAALDAATAITGIDIAVNT